MVSKSITIGLVGLLVLGLVGGSAYILLRPNDASAAQSGVAYNQPNSVGGGQGNGAQSAGQNQSDRQNQGRAASDQGGQGFAGGGRAGQGRPAASESYGEGLADHPSEARITLTGSVVTLEGDTLTIQTGEGSIAVHLGPEWYWETDGIEIAQGDELAVTGFYEGDKFEVAQVENLATGDTATLRDETGRPLWSGRGRQGQGGSLRS